MKNVEKGVEKKLKIVRVWGEDSLFQRIGKTLQKRTVPALDLLLLLLREQIALHSVHDGYRRLLDVCGSEYMGKGCGGSFKSTLQKNNCCFGDECKTTAAKSGQRQPRGYRQQLQNR